MFGYVVINKPELKIKDYDKYQEYFGRCPWISFIKSSGR